MTSPDPSYTVHLLDIAGVLILELGVVRVVGWGAAHAIVRGGEAQAIGVGGSLGQAELKGPLLLLCQTHHLRTTDFNLEGDDDEWDR